MIRLVALPATYAHLATFHDGDLALAHRHPRDTVNRGSTLAFEATLPKSGNWW